MFAFRSPGHSKEARGKAFSLRPSTRYCRQASPSPGCPSLRPDLCPFVWRTFFCFSCRKGLLRTISHNFPLPKMLSFCLRSWRPCPPDAELRPLAASSRPLGVSPSSVSRPPGLTNRQFPDCVSLCVMCHFSLAESTVFSFLFFSAVWLWHAKN